MAKKGKAKKRGKIKFKESAIIQKKDKTNVARPGTTKYPKVQGRPPANNAATFRIKIRKK